MWNGFRSVALAAGWAALVLVSATQATAQGREIVLAAPEAMAANGFLKHLLPRFSLKTQIRVSIAPLGPVEAAAAGGVDLVLVADGQLPDLPDGFDGRRLRVFSDADEITYVAAMPGAAGQSAEQAEHTRKFVSWLGSEVGRRTITAYRIDDVQVYGLPGVAKREVAAIASDGDDAAGERLAYFHCGRCHVIGPRNRMGGIGSTPSFGALKTLSDWEERFTGFYVLNPHPSFTQVEDVTEPFDPARPPHIAPVELTLDEVEAILAFVRQIAPKDLGGAIIQQ